MLTAIDIDACTQALVLLFTQPELRQKLGANGRQRACEIYDWRVIIAAYERLWQELAELRESSSELAPQKAQAPPNPLGDDPFRLFAHYSTEVLNPNQVLAIGSMGNPRSLHLLRSLGITNFGADYRTPVATIDELLKAIAQAGHLTVAEILHRYGAANLAARIRLARTLVYLLKFDILRLGQTK